ncbi:MAG TPA: hypothetical protein VNH40_12735, partial [Gaiellaceae bacterium]|nr:hypothetical protein [Gaiellaceae bacterium]
RRKRGAPTDAYRSERRLCTIDVQAASLEQLSEAIEVASYRLFGPGLPPCLAGAREVARRVGLEPHAVHALRQSGGLR